ncbi:unnamed protein product [Prorocentrum cordatum]|uniref:Uncharacterized protein n=1 Tax=Prorocentrum cordatum TaxID=2364126 RepID=A0ABN9UY80_9DINO|nr:unnamed protein product [Polarella glacialis]
MARLYVNAVSWLLVSWMLAPVFCTRDLMHVDLALNSTEDVAGMAGIKCCQIKYGILEPNFYSVNDGLLSIRLKMSTLGTSDADVKDKICTQPQGKLSLGYCSNAKYTTGDGNTVFELQDVKTLSDDVCEGDPAIKECDDFEEWKMVLIEHGLQTGRSDAAFPDLAAKDWGTSRYQSGSESLWATRASFVGAGLHSPRGASHGSSGAHGTMRSGIRRALVGRRG